MANLLFFKSLDGFERKLLFPSHRSSSCGYLRLWFHYQIISLMIEKKWECIIHLMIQINQPITNYRQGISHLILYCWIMDAGGGAFTIVAMEGK